MNGHTITEMAKLAGVNPKRILDWESAGYFQPLLCRKGKRVVRHYPHALAEKLCRVANLVRQGYKVAAAFHLASAADAASVPLNVA